MYVGITINDFCLYTPIAIDVEVLTISSLLNDTPFLHIHNNLSSL